MSNSNTRDIKQVEGAVAARKNTPGRIEDGMSYEERLFHHAYRVGYEDPDFLMFRGLQTLNIINLQNELARCKADIWTKQAASEDSLQRIKRTMHEYGICGIYVYSRCMFLTSSQPTQCGTSNT